MHGSFIDLATKRRLHMPTKQRHRTAAISRRSYRSSHHSTGKI